MLTRRGCLHLIAASGLCSFIPLPARAAALADNRLVVVILRGAWDGLDVVRPYGDPAYVKLRPESIAGENAAVPDLDGFFGLHPALSPTRPLFESKELSFAHAVATPYRNRSHFEGQDILEEGTILDSPQNVGWLNRLVGLIAYERPSFAVDIGSGNEIVLRGPNKISNWYPELKVDLEANSAQFLQAIYKGDPILEPSFAEIQQMRGLTSSVEDIDPGISTRELAQLAGTFLNEQARIVAFSLTGWDTHTAQDKRLSDLLRSLSTMILTLKATLRDNWQKTVVFMCSEFGRTARFNGTKGTDHGTGGLAVLAGGLLTGGRGGQVITRKWPGLGDGQLYEDRDLMPTDDLRRYPAWLISSLFGLTPSEVTRTIFPSLEMGDPLNLV